MTWQSEKVYIYQIRSEICSNQQTEIAIGTLVRSIHLHMTFF